MNIFIWKRHNKRICESLIIVSGAVPIFQDTREVDRRCQDPVQ